MRKALRKFTEQQEAVLKENDYKHGWKLLSNSVCWKKLNNRDEYVSNF